MKFFRYFPDFRNSSIIILLGLAFSFGCTSSNTTTIDMAVVGQTLVKMHPEKHLSDPYSSIKQIIKSADVGFTNFEMAVDGNCDLPDDYQVMLGEPALGKDIRPGNTGGPHAVNENVMEFLSGMNFNLQSLANNHSWDLGGCGIKATIAAAKKYGVTHAGTGNSLEEATLASIIEVKGIKIALIAASTGKDEREITLASDSSPGINGVWTGVQDDWDRNIAAVKSARENADIVIYYHHFQIDQEDADEEKDGHKKVEDIFEWQESLAKAVIDAGAGMYIAHGNRIFDGVEIYKGRPIFRQLGGFSYQGLQQKGAYDPLVWEGLLGMLKITDGYINSIEISPLELNEGMENESVTPVESREKRGLSEIATGDKAAKILNRFKELSAKYGANVTINGEKAAVEIKR